MSTLRRARTMTRAACRPAAPPPMMRVSTVCMAPSKPEEGLNGNGFQSFVAGVTPNPDLAKLVPKGWGVVGIRQHEASARIGNPAVEGRRLVYPLGVVEPLRSKKVA